MQLTKFEDGPAQTAQLLAEERLVRPEPLCGFEGHIRNDLG